MPAMEVTAAGPDLSEPSDDADDVDGEGLAAVSEFCVFAGVGVAFPVAVWGALVNA